MRGLRKRVRGERKPQRRKQGVVRVEKLDATLEAFNAEQGDKVARTIAEYHTRLVEPRLEYLESWWWQKLWFRTKQFFRWTFRIKPPPPVLPAEEPPESISHEEMKAAMEGFEKEAETPKL